MSMHCPVSGVTCVSQNRRKIDKNVLLMYLLLKGLSHEIDFKNVDKNLQN